MKRPGAEYVAFRLCLFVWQVASLPRCFSCFLEIYFVVVPKQHAFIVSAGCMFVVLTTKLQWALHV